MQWLCFSALLVVGSCASQNDEPEVVVYVSADETLAREVFDAFEKQTGIQVLAVFDTEATKTTGLASRLLAERNRPRADIFWSSECFRTIELDRAGLFAPLRGEPFDDWLSDSELPWRSAEGTWFGFAPRARVLVYARDRIPEDEVPNTWWALSDSPWAGRITMADPRFGTTSGHVGMLAALWGEDLFSQWVDGMAQNKTVLLPGGNGAVVEAVANGEYDLGLTDTDDVFAGRALGWDLGMVMARSSAPGASDGGSLLIPNSVARVAGGPNPEAARQFTAWLLSAEAERILAESPSGNFRVLDIQPGNELTCALTFDPLLFSPERAADAMPLAVQIAHQRLDAQ